MLYRRSDMLYQTLDILYRSLISYRRSDIISDIQCDIEVRNVTSDMI